MIIYNIVEKENDDGFCHRLILYAPEDSTHDGDAILTAGPSKVTFCCVFLFIYLLHANITRKYTFDEEACNILKIEFDRFINYKRLAQACNYTLA